MLLVIFVALEVCSVQNAVVAKECKGGDKWANEGNPIYYYNCLVEGVQVQLKCPPGQYFNNVAGACITGNPANGSGTATTQPTKP